MNFAFVFKNPDAGTWFGQPRQTWSREATSRTGRETDQIVISKYAGRVQRGTVAGPGEPARRAPTFDR